MITTILSDFSRVLLFPKDPHYKGGLNELNKKLITEQGTDYDFSQYFTLNEELLTLYKDLKDRHTIYILTMSTIQNHPSVRAELDPLVEDIFTAEKHNLSKSDPKAYTYVAETLQKIPETFLYIDDLVENVEAARKAGMTGVHFKDTKQAITELNEFLN